MGIMRGVGAPTTWVMSNHDVVRHASRLATGIGGTAGGASAGGLSGDPVVGLRRARAAALLMVALPGSLYLYQGEELGLPEVFDLPPEARQDPIFARSAGTELGRDGCRVPLPWSGSAPPYGFGPGGSWLPQPDTWAELSAAAQRVDPDSTLSLYTRALRLRRELPALGAGELRWLSGADDDVLIFERPSPEGGGAAVICAVNQGTTPVHVRDATPILASAPLAPDGKLLPDAAAWWAC
jgi:alpha-glucosidase